MVVLLIFPVILQTDINVIMLSIGGQARKCRAAVQCSLAGHLLPIWRYMLNLPKSASGSFIVL